MEPVHVDDNGTFKYVLINLYKTDNTTQPLVRGFKWASYHDDIYQETLREATAKGLDTECIGGGRIKHDPDKKELFVYGYSMGYGRADHEVTVKLLKEKYKDYSITWSNEGY